RRQRAFALRPHARARLHADAVRQSKGAYAVAKTAVVAISGIGQHNSDRDTGRFRCPNLFQGDLRLRRKADLLRDARTLTTLGVLRPSLRQIQSPGDRQTSMPRSQRQTHCHLAVRLFTELPAILVRDTHRMFALLREAGVVNDPVAVVLQSENRLNPLLDTSDDTLVRPRRLRYQMMQRLMLGADVIRIGVRGQRLNALTFDRQHQGPAIVCEARASIRVT